MTNTIAFRELKLEDLPAMVEIDRAETIDAIYTVTDGQLVLHEKQIDVHGWYPSEVPAHVEHLASFIQAGGAAFGAFDGERLVGIGGLNIGPIGGDTSVMQLEPLHVSSGYRGRGIGRRLVELVADRARSLGGRALYISSISTRNSVDAYLRLGATVLENPDPVLFAKEPEDIHLLLWLDGDHDLAGSERAG